MKKLFVSVFVIGLILLGIPLVLLGLMYERDTDALMPLELYYEEADGFSLLYAELATALQAAQDDDTTNLHVMLDENSLNTLIFNYIRGDGPFKEAINPDYLPGPDCDSASCATIFEEVFTHEGRRFIIQLKGLWVQFDEETLHLNAALAFNYQDRASYQTVVRTELNLESGDTPGVYTLTYEGMRIGRLPLPSRLFNTMSTWFDRVTSYDFDEAIDMASRAIRIERQPLSLTLDLPALIKQASETLEADPGAELGLTIIDALLQEDLLTLAFEQAGIGMQVQLDALRIESDTMIPEVLLAQRDAAGFIPQAFSFETHLKTQLETWLIARALGHAMPFHIPVDLMNAALYHEAGGFERFQYEFDYRDATGSPAILFMGLEAFWLEFAQDETDSAKALMTLYGLFDFGGLKTRIALKNTGITTDNESVLTFSLHAITLGDDADPPALSFSEVDRFVTLLDTLAWAPFIEVDATNQLILDGEALFNEMGKQDVWRVTVMTIIDTGILVDITPQNPTLEDTLNAMTSALFDVLSAGLSHELETVLDDQAESQAFLNHLKEIETVLAADDPLDEADVTLLMAQLDALPELARQQFTDTLTAQLDPSIQDAFNDAFLN